jgi:hypothetical protein
MPLPRKIFYPVPACCGAGSDPGGEVIKNNINARLNAQLAFAFTDVPVEGSVKITDNLYVQMPDNRDWEPTSPYVNKKEGPYPRTYGDSDRSYLEKMYPQSGEIKLQPEQTVKILYCFLTSNWPGYKDRLSDKLEDASNLPWVAICASEQHSGTEPLLLELGFKIIKRKTSPKTNNRLTLYYKEPVQ